MVVNHGLFFNPNRPLTSTVFRKTENTQNNSFVYSYLEGEKKKKGLYESLLKHSSTVQI